MRYYEISEDAVPSPVFAAAKRAQQTLSFPATSALDAWETSNWIGGKLEEHFAAMDEIAHEIVAAFEPVRQLLPMRATLYRGIQANENYDNWKNKILYSWTSDRRVAEHFAGLRGVKGYGSNTTFPSHIRPVMSDEAINHYVSQYEQKGFVKIGNRRYIRSRENPKYYQIYNGFENITDGSNLRNELLNNADWNEEINQAVQSRGEVFEEEISRDRIIWLTNSVNCKEFIVR